MLSPLTMLEEVMTDRVANLGSRKKRYTARACQRLRKKRPVGRRSRDRLLWEYQRDVAGDRVIHVLDEDVSIHAEGGGQPFRPSPGPEIATPQDGETR
jgi:hypothetical protein